MTDAARALFGTDGLNGTDIERLAVRDGLLAGEAQDPAPRSRCEGRFAPD